ncbi:MAG TPA: glycosyltransferase family 39 protein [Candidatus Binatia bacterium]|nr:glycosyltransferase family 39 protein [Candidatus Binatia bacterium]
MDTLNTVSTLAYDKPIVASERGTRWDIVFLAAIFIALAAWTYLLPPIWNHGEAREGLVVQDIVRDHEWVLPDPNEGIPSKPPLFHWIGAVLAIAFGLSDWTVRLPSALAAGAMATMTFMLGKAIGGRRTGWLAVGALLGMYEFWVSGTEARVDMVFATCVTASLTGFFFWQRDGREWGRAVCYLGAACAVLAKGPAGAAFPALVIIAFLIVDKRPKQLWRLWSWPWVALTLAIDIGWYAGAYHIGGKPFLEVQIFRENFDQVLGTNGFSTRHGKFAAFGWLATRLFPWNLALLVGLLRRTRGSREDSTGRFLHSWWMVIFVIVFLSTIKRAIYLLPAYPAVALLAGRELARIADSGALKAHLARLKISRLQSVGLIIALVDLVLLLPNPSVWKRNVAFRSMLDFVRDVETVVPANGRFFAAPELANPTLQVVAYRLERHILRMPIACGAHDDYFLAPALAAAGGEAEVLATSADGKSIVMKGGRPDPESCAAEKAHLPAIDEDDSD